jgi:ketosteroid isomerase-like protein
MPDHPNAILVRRATDALMRGDMQAIADSLADDVVWHMIGSNEPIRGKAALLAAMSGADYQITGSVHDVVANDDHTIVLAENTATRGDRSLTYRTAEILHIRDGKLVERWAFSDDTEAINEFFA